MNQDIEIISKKILELIPQQDPFRFIDRIIEIDEERIIGQYTFKDTEWFYKGHFPGNPITPGVILVEAMAQTSVVAFGLYLSFFGKDANLEDSSRFTTLFTSAESEFYKPVKPGETVTIKGKKEFFRRRKLKSSVELFLENGELAASAVLSGLGVRDE